MRMNRFRKVSLTRSLLRADCNPQNNDDGDNHLQTSAARRKILQEPLPLANYLANFSAASIGRYFVDVIVGVTEYLVHRTVSSVVASVLHIFVSQWPIPVSQSLKHQRMMMWK